MTSLSGACSSSSRYKHQHRLICAFFTIDVVELFASLALLQTLDILWTQRQWVCTWRDTLGHSCRIGPGGISKNTSSPKADEGPRVPPCHVWSHMYAWVACKGMCGSGLSSSNVAASCNLVEPCCTCLKDFSFKLSYFLLLHWVFVLGKSPRQICLTLLNCDHHWW